MKKILSLILIFGIFTPFSISFAKAKERYFIVTAYYSPLPNQKYYLTWNYKDEITLNWNWIKWASGKKVFSWMLAWPSWYKFWTKIYLQWLGVGEIADRWGAIVHAWNRWYKYDRIDLWVGYWDEWLKRALYWGKRKIKWKILNKDSKITINYKKIPAPNWAVKWLKKANTIQIPKIFNTWIWIKSPKYLITNLQQILKELDIYNWKIDWIYNEDLINSIYQFQKENNIIKNKYSPWAWYFWPKTRKLIKELYIKQKAIQRALEIIKQNAKLHAQSKLSKIWKVAYWDISPWVRELQKLLKELGYFNYKDTAIFGKLTKKALIQYQLDKKIIKSPNSIEAGYFGPKTRNALTNDLIQRYISKKIEENKDLAKLKNKNLF